MLGAVQNYKNEKRSSLRSFSQTKTEYSRFKELKMSSLNIWGNGAFQSFEVETPSSHDKQVTMPCLSLG